MGRYPAVYFSSKAITIAANVRSSQSLCVLSLLPPPCLLRRFVLRLRSLSSFRAVRQLTMPVVTNACGFLITYLAAGRPIYDFHGNGIRPLLLLNLFFQYHHPRLVSFLFYLVAMAISSLHFRNVSDFLLALREFSRDSHIFRYESSFTEFSAKLNFRPREA